jgi:hypothetical protein
MGVIPINFSPEVEVFIKGSRKGTRSQVVDRVMKKYIQAQLGDGEMRTIIEATASELTAAALSKSHDITNHNQEWYDRAILLRDIFLKHLEESK